MDRIINNDVNRDALMRATTEQATGNMQLSMTESPATGKTYQRGNKVHIASSPGNPPRVDMGTLRGSLKIIKLGNKRYAIRTSVLHGFETEFGVGMPPRPWMRPAVAAIPTWIIGLAKKMGVL